MADKNPTNKDEAEMLTWLLSQPELYERLKQIRSLQSSNPDLDRAELELLELTRSIGASSFKAILQQKRDCHWREARLCAARVHGESATVYGVNFGSVGQAGYTWADTVAKLPWSASTQLHALGDGASWIAKQCQQCLGANYLVDFFHVCEYLAAAATKAATHPKWLQVQKNRLKNNRADKVIETLKPYLEEENISDENAPVRAAIRYIENRIDQLDYKSAIENDLPIGSGMIESAHRHVIQQRLKRAGTWWTHDNAQRMAALRVVRANQIDENYWKSAA